MTTLTADQIQFLSTFLSNLNDGSADWQEIAQQRGITRKDNATTSFKNIVKKIGLQYDSKKFTQIEGFEFADSATKAKASPRKRKTDDKDGNDAKDGKSPTKKKRNAQAAKEADGEDRTSERDISNTENGVKTEIKDEAEATASSDE